MAKHSASRRALKKIIDETIDPRKGKDLSEYVWERIEAELNNEFCMGMNEMRTRARKIFLNSISTFPKG